MQAEALTVKRSNHLRLVPGVDEEHAMWSVGDACAALYNELNYRRRGMWFTHRARRENKQQWDGDDVADKYKPIIEATVAQQVQRRLNTDWHTFFRQLKAKAEGRLPVHIKPRPPGYKKRPNGQREPFIIVRNDRYKIIEGKRPDRRLIRCEEQPVDQVSHIVLPVPPRLREEGVENLKVAFRGVLRWRGKPKTITRRRRQRRRSQGTVTVAKTIAHSQGALRIWFDDADNVWRASQSVEASTRRSHPGPAEANSTHDLGVICLTCRVRDGERQAVAYSGRELLSDWWYMNRRIANVESRLKTENDRHTSRLLRRLYALRGRRHDHAVKAMLKAEVHLGVAFGDVTGRRQDYRTNSPRLNEMIHLFWGFRKLYRRADELHEARTGNGKVPCFDEKDTSTRCPWCRSPNTRTQGRLFKCRDCGVEAHRDVVGAVNIDAVRNGGGRVNGMMAHPLLHRWDRTLGAWKHKGTVSPIGEKNHPPSGG